MDGWISGSVGGWVGDGGMADGECICTFKWTVSPSGGMKDPLEAQIMGDTHPERETERGREREMGREGERERGSERSREMGMEGERQRERDGDGDGDGERERGMEMERE